MVSYPSTNPAMYGQKSNSQLVNHKPDPLTITLPSHLTIPINGTFGNICITLILEETTVPELHFSSSSSSSSDGGGLGGGDSGSSITISGSNSNKAFIFV